MQEHDPYEDGRRLSRAERQERTRALLLDAASSLIARNGFATTSIDEITAAAGFTKGAFYSNFSSKEDLLLELFEAQAERGTSELLDALAAATTMTERFEAVDRWVRLTARRNRGAVLLELELVLAAVRQSQLRRKLADRYERIRSQVREALIEYSLVPEGAADVDQIAGAIVAMSDALPLQYLVDSSALPPDTFSSALSRMLGLTAPTAPIPTRTLP